MTGDGLFSLRSFSFTPSTHMSQSDILNAQHQEIAKNTTQLDNFTTEILENDVEDAVTESEPDAEEEIDQLDSDSEAPPEQPQPNVRAPKKPSSSRTSERRPGQALLPTVRIENILQAEGVQLWCLLCSTF